MFVFSADGYVTNNEVTISEKTRTNHVVEDININTNYTLRVRAKLSNGTEGPWTEAVTARGMEPCEYIQLYTLSNFEFGGDVTCGRLYTSLRVTIRCVCFASIPYRTHKLLVTR